MFINGWKKDLLRKTWGEKAVPGVETRWIFSNEKVIGAVERKEGHADSLLGHKSSNHFWFPWKKTFSWMGKI